MCVCVFCERGVPTNHREVSGSPKDPWCSIGALVGNTGVSPLILPRHWLQGQHTAGLREGDTLRGHQPYPILLPANHCEGTGGVCVCGGGEGGKMSTFKKHNHGTVCRFNSPLSLNCPRAVIMKSTSHTSRNQSTITLLPDD